MRSQLIMQALTYHAPLTHLPFFTTTAPVLLGMSDRDTA